MWNSTGRSGIGGTNQDGTYDDLEGLTPNGRQYRNEATLETRDLSGADYWHLRKQSRPTEDVPECMRAVNDTMNLAHCLPNGNANLLAYADPVVSSSRKTSISIQDRILPQVKRLRLLTDQLIELEQTYKSGGMSIESYSMYRAVLVQKRNRATVLYNKAVNVSEPAYEVDDIYREPSTQPHTSTQTVHCSVQNTPQNDEERSDIPVWLSSISDENTFKNSLISACHTYQKLVQLSHKLKRWYKAFSIEAKAFYRKWEGIER